MHELVVVADEACCGIIIQTNIRGQRLESVVGVVHIVLHFIEQSYLCVCLGELLRVLVSVREGAGSIGFEVDHTIALLVAFELSLSVSEFRIDLFQTSVDKLFGTLRHLVLVLVGLSVVADRELLQVVNGALWVLIAQSQLCDRCGLASLRDVELAYIFICSEFRRLDIDFHHIAVLHRHHRVGVETDDTCTCANSGRQLRECLVDTERTVSLVVVDGYEVGAGDVITVARTLNLQVDRRVESLQV